MTGPDFDPEKLRPAEHVHEPDPRNALTAWVDRTSGVIRPVQLSDLYDAVASFSIRPGVPEDIAQHFETVNNLYLYSWFIYRFQPVAELQGLACLEYALRMRLANEIKAGRTQGEAAGPAKNDEVRHRIKACEKRGIRPLGSRAGSGVGSSRFTGRSTPKNQKQLRAWELYFDADGTRSHRVGS